MVNTAKIKIFTTFVLVAWMCIPSIGQSKKAKLISVEATRYEISFLNSFQHTLRIALKDRGTRKVEHFTLNPGQVKTFKGNFDKDKLQDLEVFCTYDFETYRADLIRFQEKILSINSKKHTQIKTTDWFQFVSAFINVKNIKSYIRDYDFTQMTIDEKSAEDLAFDISDKVARDNILFANLEDENFGSHSPTTAKGAVVAVLELAHNASDFNYVNQVKYLKSMMELLSNKNFVQTNRDLVYNMADGLDLRNTAPDYMVSFTPIIFTQNLNDSWIAPNEIGIDGEKILSGGWFNNTLSFHVSKAITSEIRLGNPMLHGRLYASLFYEKIAYGLNERGVYSVMDTYVDTKENAPGPYFDITNKVNDITLEMSQIGGSIISKVMVGDWMFFDLEGGLISKQGRLNFREGIEHFEDNINVLDLLHSNRTKVLNPSFAPFIKIKNGIGHSPRKGTGFYFTTSFVATQSFLETNDQYDIYVRTPTNETLVPTTSNSWLYSLTFGVDYLF